MNEQIDEKGYLIVTGENSLDSITEKLISSSISSSSASPLTSYSFDYLTDITSELSPRTDGAFLDGIAIQHEGSFFITPPKYLLLRYLEPSAEGLYLIDGQLIHNDLPEMDRELLSQPGCCAFLSDDTNSTSTSIFSYIDDQIVIRFHSSKKMLVPKWAHESSHKFLELTQQPTRHIHLNCNVGDIIIIDNHRMMHARQALAEGSKREFKRLWKVSPATLTSPFAGINDE